MDFVDCLLEEHDNLRSSVKAIDEALAEISRGVGPRVDQLETILGMERLLLATFRAHEQLESSLLPEAVKRLPPEEGAILRTVKADHEVLNAFFHILEGLLASGDVSDLYGMRFCLARIRAELDRHLAHEERSLFPVLRRLWPRLTIEALKQKNFQSVTGTIGKSPRV
jgi:hemerythrin-like domain-containing protein